jgi:uncharacterized OB-fold protein
MCGYLDCERCHVKLKIEWVDCEGVHMLSAMLIVYHVNLGSINDFTEPYL